VDFLRNAWYVAAWPEELGRELFPRTFLNDRVVLYRTENGAAVAMADSCPHRFAPLHMGRLVGDAVQCAYHGLRFDSNGACVLSPFDEKIPRNARVRVYPLTERFGLVWIWMGDPERADPARIPDFSYLTEKTRKIVPGRTLVQANYELIVDNLADLTHTHFLHSSFLKTEAFERGEHEVVQEGTTVHSKFWFPNGRVTPIVGKFMDDPDLIVDRWTEIRWDPPCLIRLNSGATPTGRPRSDGIQLYGTHLLTPETDTSTHYFYAHARAFKQDDPKTDELVREWQRVAFNEEDKPIIEAQQRNLGTRDLMSLRPVLLSSDAGAIRIRRVLAKCIEGERREPNAVQA
jgi:phenylpropionate dioxygenase-like ring-hydroxylating dioxygenase large terminal subunit